MPRALRQTFGGGKGEADDAQLVGLALLGGRCTPVDSRGLDERVQRVRLVPPGAEDSAGEHRDEQRGLHCTQPVAESVLVGCEDQRLGCVVCGLAGMEGSVSLKRLRRGLVARHVVPTLAADRAAEIGPPRRGGREARHALAAHGEVWGGHFQRTTAPARTEWKFKMIEWYAGSHARRGSQPTQGAVWGDKSGHFIFQNDHASNKYTTHTAHV